jgi:DUF1680 family protein
MVNLFVASEVIWKRAGGAVAIVQDTDYPATNGHYARCRSTLKPRSSRH